MTKAEHKKHLCPGCRNDFYNQPGNSTTGECWHLQDAEVVQLTQIGIWQDPPYEWDPQSTLSCHQTIGKAWIRPDDPRVRPAP